MNLADRARITVAVWWYGVWLDLSNVPGRRRRELRRELAANLREATAAKGARSAVADLGGLRRLAAETAGDARRPRWSSAILFAVTAGVSVLFVQVFAALNWVQGAEASQPAQVARGSLFPFPGSEVAYLPPAGDGVGIGFEISFGWLYLVVAALVFVGVARPWRLVTRRW